MLLKFTNLLLLALLPLALCAQAPTPDSLKTQLKTAGLFFEKGDFKKGSELALQVIQTAEKADIPGIMGRAYQALAAGAFNVSDFQKAAEYARTALQINRREGDTYGEADNHMMLAVLWLATNQLDSALLAGQESVRLFRQIGDAPGLAVALTKVGHVFNVRGEYAKATPFYLESWQISSADSLGVAFSNANLCLASNYIYLKKYDLALRHAQKCLEIADARGSFYERSTALDYISNIYEMKGNLPKALEYQRRYTAARDSVLQESRLRQAKELEVKYEAAKKEGEIKLLENEKARQRAVIWAVLASLALLAFVAARIYRGYRQSRLDNRQLSSEKAETEQRLFEEQRETERLAEIEAFKSRFFTNITHEFRTPLTAILGNLDLMKLDLEKNAPPADALLSKVSTTERNAENLLRLINQLLDLAKLESNALPMNFVQGNVSEWLRYATESLHSLAESRGIALSLDCPREPVVMDYDPERLLQIVHNLLSNALKFTPAGGRVSVQAQVLATGMPGFEHLPQLFLQVSDTGTGISPEDLPRVFDRFFQAQKQEQAKSGGTGIGLALTRELVRAMHGEISAKSELGRGSVFTLRLPMTNAAPLQTAPLPSKTARTGVENPRGIELPKNSPETPGDKPQILLIEDNPDVLAYLGACLQDKYHLDFAENGRIGIERALETVPDLIISDVMMPEKDGFEVCETLKNHMATSHIPLILLTARATVEDRIAGLRRGADVYLAKPFHREELLVQVQNLLENRQKLRERWSAAQGDLPFSGKAAAAPEAAKMAEGKPPEAQLPDLEDLFVQKVRAAVEAQLDDAALSAETLARSIGMSRSQLHRKLTALTDKSPTQFIRFFRMRHAQALLLAGEKNVSEVAYAVGFDDPKYFSRVFSEEFGVAPSELRGR